MLKQLKENLNKIFGDEEVYVAPKKYCKCGKPIKCPLCKTKKSLKSILDDFDTSIHNSSTQA